MDFDFIPPELREEAKRIALKLAHLSEHERGHFFKRWAWYRSARANQLIPIKGRWTKALVMAGRGYGKTRVGAEWIAEEAWRDAGSLNTVIAPTWSDVEHTCFKGESGLLNAFHPSQIAKFDATDMILTLKQGSMIRGFSAEKPERLRGPQHHRIWWDELAACVRMEEVQAMAEFGLRLGRAPRILYTTTPKPKDMIRQLVKEHEADPEDVLLITGSTYENKANLATRFFKTVSKYEGTKLGDQELHAKILDEDGEIIRREWLRLWPAARPLPVLEFVVMSLDTAFTQRTIDKKTHDPDETACSVWGLFRESKYEWGIMLVDAWSDLLGFPDLLARVKKERMIRWGHRPAAPLILNPLIGPKRPIDTGKAADILLIEEKGSGISLRQSLKSEGIDSHGYNPGRQDKLQRLHAISHLFHAGRIWIPENPNTPGKTYGNFEKLITQLTSFKGEGSIKHDDYVDSVTQAVRYFADFNHLPVTLRPEEIEAEWEPDDVEPEPVRNPYY